MASARVNASPNRPDIYGLRGLALLAVFIFHLNKNLIPGFIVGVDMFFVLSGFLITQQILKAIESDKFSLLSFYHRRVKRLALPLLLMVTVVMLVAAVLMTPRDFNAAANSALFSLLSFANLYFWLFQEGGYFSASSETLPLLHLWSLGVVEQFYLFWPILLMLTYHKKRSKAFLLLTVLGALASFAFGQFYFDQDSSFTYFMLPSRIGEFLVGGLVAMLVIREVHHRVPLFLITPIAVTGLLLLLVSFAWINEEQVFPGFRAAMPAIGVAVLIFSGYCGRSRISQLFEFPPLAWLGLVSYSAYLWHWPVLAMLRYESIPVDLVTGLLVCLVTLLLAFLSYTLVEVPGLFWDATVSRVFIFQYIVPACLVGILTLVAKFYLSPEVPLFKDTQMNNSAFNLSRLTPIAQSLAEPISSRSLLTIGEIDTGLHDAPRPAFEFDYVCQREQITARDTQNSRCVLGGGNLSSPRVLLWGDSNAAHHIGVVAEIAKKADFSFRNIAVEACPPLFEDPSPFVLGRRVADCRLSMPAVAAAVNLADVVIISASWTSYASRSSKIFEATFAMIQSLTMQGKLVILLGKTPVMTSFNTHCKEREMRFATSMNCVSSEVLSEEVKFANAQLQAFAERTKNVEYFEVTPYLCKDDKCSATDAQGNPIYYDAGHISMPGSWKIGESVVRQSGVPNAFEGVVPWLNQTAKKP